MFYVELSNIKEYIIKLTCKDVTISESGFRKIINLIDIDYGFYPTWYDDLITGREPFKNIRQSMSIYNFDEVLDESRKIERGMTDLYKHTVPKIIIGGLSFNTYHRTGVSYYSFGVLNELTSSGHSYCHGYGIYQYIKENITISFNDYYRNTLCVAPYNQNIRRSND